MAIKVKVIADVTVYDGNKTFGKGSMFDYSGGEAAVEKLIELGYVEKAGKPSAAQETEKERAAKAAEKEAEKAAKAAEKRKKAEEAAVEKGLGTADEVAQLSDDELQELFKAAK
jgi:hypothetical protein